MPDDRVCTPVGGYVLTLVGLTVIFYSFFSICGGCFICCGCGGQGTRYLRGLSNTSTDGEATSHMERVRQRVHLRNNPQRMGVWHKTQTGFFAARGEPPPGQASQAVPGS